MPLSSAAWSASSRSARPITDAFGALALWHRGCADYLFAPCAAMKPLHA